MYVIVDLSLLGIHDLLERDAELLAYGLKLGQIFLVLALVLRFEFNTLGESASVMHIISCV